MFDRKTGGGNEIPMELLCEKNSFRLYLNPVES